MQLREMDVRARIVGLHAEVITELTFYNPNRRLLEGELQFPLPDGAVVTGYALDVNGQMVDGVVVKKEKARVAFETEVRAGVDPGLVEHVAGNVYRTRIYPLPAQGSRRIRLKYVAEVPTDAHGDAACFLPMPIGETVSRLSIRVEVAQGVVKPEIGGFGNLRFRSFHNVWIAETELRDAKPGEDIWVALPNLPPQIAAVERTPDGEVFFAISDLPVAVLKSRPTPEPPRRVGIAWDASGSRNGEHLQKEITALKQLGVELVVLVFRDRPEPIRPLRDPDSLRDIAYDGGTDLAAAADAIRASEIAHWLLFTDGLDTLGDRLPDFGDKHVTAVVSQTVAHRELLRQVCASVVDLQRSDGVLILAPVTRLVRVHGTGISDVQGLGATAEGRVSIHGKLTANASELRLEYSDGHTSAPIRISRENAAEGVLLASVWAARRAQQLAVRADANEEQLLVLGRRFGVVSPVTSLIVLENVDQYVRHDIEPPSSLPDLRRQWQERKAALAKQEPQKRIRKLERVLAMWKERVAWWEQIHRVPPDFKYQAELRKEGGLGERIAGALSALGGAMAPAQEPRRAMERLARAVPQAAVLGAAAVADLKASESRPADATIVVKPWDPAVPYLSALKAAAKENRYKTYLQQRKQFAQSPSFFVDCAEFFLREGDKTIAVRVLTNLAEMKLEEASLLRVLAWRLQQAGELQRAIVVLRKVQKLRPEEPQSHRDLALALAEAGQTAEAVELLAEVVRGEWQRFEEIEVIALEELNALLARTKLPPPPSLDPRLIKNLDVDIRIVMSWDADATDVDLHVVEPTGEEAAYNHNRTRIGGLVSRDFTQGYGPEEYLVRRAVPGLYKIFAHYYGSRQQTVIGPATITATVFTDFGRPTEKKQVLTLRLDKPRDRAEIGEVRFAGDKPFPVIKGGGRGEEPEPLSREAFRAIRVGQPAEEVRRQLGEPERKEGDVWFYRRGDRRYKIEMSESGRVRSVIEILPGGAKMILAH